MTKFELGQLVLTAGVADIMETDGIFAAFVQLSLGRFQNEDWGDICDEDKEVNEDALVNTGRLIGVYKNPNHPTIWIITEADRSVTTILFPEEC